MNGPFLRSTEQRNSSCGSPAVLEVGWSRDLLLAFLETVAVDEVGVQPVVVAKTDIVIELGVDAAAHALGEVERRVDQSVALDLAG